MAEDREGKKKIYTIRGIDPETYEAFSKLARDLNTSIGRLISEAMRLTITLGGTGTKIGLKKLGELSSIITKGGKTETYDENIEVITGIKELEVSKTDLEKTEKPIVLLNMRKLTFSNDVTWDLLDQKIKEIKLVDEIVIPSHIPKLKLAKKCIMVERIIVGKEK
ncbi:MAG: hypothetical protein F7B60_00375 [Desulfurococcales archaeon]|nr:hypothetical protein [Desulfurococcales archaeon]